MQQETEVLIVEDDPALLRGLVDKFRADGCNVRVACDGFSAIDAAEENPPDIVILDIMLPGCSGFDVCRSLREESELTMPILMLTARGQEEDIVRGLNVGADDYITKPFSIAELRARVNAALRRCQSNGSAAKNWRFGDFELDMQSQELRRQDKVIALTRQEFSFLAYFLANPGRALTREMILRSGERRSALTGARSVDRCIKNLRSKIEANPRRPRHILTIRDVGYRFQL